MTKSSLYSRAYYLISAAAAKQFPDDNGAEVAFVGRSNAGKSSVLNMVCQQKSLARTSKTPGRTQLINFFAVDETRRLVDLPGYGFAKVTAKMQQQWSQLIGEYLEGRECLRGLVVIMDIRHPLRDLDYQMIAWGCERQIPLLLILNKADKLSYGARIKTRNEVVKAVAQEFDQELPTIIYSCHNPIGRDELLHQVDKWMLGE